jgi:glycosyltransferase involved in cell wall biosynthesis
MAIAVPAVLRRLLRTISARSVSAVVIEKEVLPRFPVLLEPLMSAAGARLITDFDDAVYLEYKGGLSPERGRIGAVVRASRKVFAGNRHLVDVFRPLNRETVFVPTVLDLARYPAIRDHREVGRVVVGWIGSPLNTKYLGLIRGALTRLAQEKHIEIELRLIGGQPFNIPGLKIVTESWSEDTEAHSLLQLDIGIMPIPDDEWGRGKCGLKILQYMASGLPVVASAVGANLDIVLHGETGYLARTQEQWWQYLLILASNHVARRTLGEAGRERVREAYSLERWGEVYVREVAKVVVGA